MKIRIHGDNIIECERALKLLGLAYDAVIVDNTKDIFMPLYLLQKNNKNLFEVELLSGHNRWNVNFSIELAKSGAPLREATDAYITKVSTDNKTEELLLAIEFCNALPAGNNAWQRNGRAATCAEIGIPYFYFAEIGGVELDANRNVIAPRFPNPIVPFSYLTSSKAMNVVCVPIYQAHPAITDTLRKKFMHVFGLEASLDLLKYIINGSNTDDAMNILNEKGLALIKILSNDRKRIDTFRALEWEEFLKITTGQKKAEWIQNNPNKQIWKKKTTSKVKTTKTFQKFLDAVQKLDCFSIGAKAIPICLIDKNKIKDFTTILKSIYPKDKINELTDILENENKPFIVIWITGFKPHGDDSRPDRGLVPLARMLFGNDIAVLTVVFGPAVKDTWITLESNPKRLAKENGLWEAIINLSNYVLADSTTAENGVIAQIIQRNLERKKQKLIFNAAKPEGIFSEHDVDTAIHNLFSRQLNANIFESMCNPPGGDWSGISYWDFINESEYRWTSLPRVSAIKAKRPDHIIHINTPTEEIFLVIESKNHAKDLEDNIGNRLCEYVKALFKIAPTAYKLKNDDWKLFEETTSPLSSISTFSGGAFCYKSTEEMGKVMDKGKLDFIFAFEFANTNVPSVLHVILSDKSKFLNNVLIGIIAQFRARLEIKIY